MRNVQRAKRVFLSLAQMRSTKLAQKLIHLLHAAEPQKLPRRSLCQGTTLVVPPPAPTKDLVSLRLEHAPYTFCKCRHHSEVLKSTQPTVDPRSSRRCTSTPPESVTNKIMRCLLRTGRGSMLHAPFVRRLRVFHFESRISVIDGSQIGQPIERLGCDLSANSKENICVCGSSRLMKQNSSMMQGASPARKGISLCMSR